MNPMKPIRQIVDTFFAIYDMGDTPQITRLRAKAEKAFKAGKHVFEYTTTLSQATRKVSVNTTIIREW